MRLLYRACSPSCIARLIRNRAHRIRTAPVLDHRTGRRGQRRMEGVFGSGPNGRLPPGFGRAFMHLCWAEDGTCLADTVLFGFFRDILDDFATLAVPHAWQEASNASLRMGPTEVRQNGISVDAAAFFWGTEERVLGRRYLLDATSGTWTVLDDADTAEDAVYSHHHATIPWLDMEVEWPAGAFEAGTFHQLVLPALTSGVTAGSVSREIRVTPLDSVHWGGASRIFTSAVRPMDGCGTWDLFDPAALQAGQTVPEPIVADWSSRWSRTALTRMRSLLNAYYTDMADPNVAVTRTSGGRTAEKFSGTFGSARAWTGRQGHSNVVQPGDPQWSTGPVATARPASMDLSEAAFAQMALTGDQRRTVTVPQNCRGPSHWWLAGNTKSGWSPSRVNRSSQL